MPFWNDIFGALTSSEAGTLIALGCLIAIACAITTSRESGALGKHLVIYTLQLGLILGLIWVGYRFVT